jgi:hypothetical protein
LNSYIRDTIYSDLEATARIFAEHVKFCSVCEAEASFAIEYKAETLRRDVEVSRRFKKEWHRIVSVIGAGRFSFRVPPLGDNGFCYSPEETSASLV